MIPCLAAWLQTATQATWSLLPIQRGPKPTLGSQTRVHQSQWRAWWHTLLGLQWGWGLRIWVSNQFPGDTDVAGVRHSFRESLNESMATLEQTHISFGKIWQTHTQPRLVRSPCFGERWTSWPVPLWCRFTRHSTSGVREDSKTWLHETNICWTPAMYQGTCGDIISLTFSSQLARSALNDAKILLSVDTKESSR